MQKQKRTAKPDYFHTRQKSTGQGDRGQGRKTKVQIEKIVDRQSWKKKPKKPPGGGKKTRRKRTRRKRTRRKKTRRKAKKRRGKTRKKNKR